MCDDDLVSVASRAATWGTYRPNSPRISEGSETTGSALSEAPVKVLPVHPADALKNAADALKNALLRGTV